MFLDTNDIGNCSYVSVTDINKITWDFVILFICFQ